MLSNFKLQLSKGQVSRLILILDEDMENNITIKEYFEALEAYNCSMENHQHVEGVGFELSFEHKSVFKLLEIIKERKITF